MRGYFEIVQMSYLSLDFPTLRSTCQRRLLSAVLYLPGHFGGFVSLFAVSVLTHWYSAVKKNCLFPHLFIQ